MISNYPPAHIDEAVTRACRELGLELSYMASVYAYLDEDEDSWPRCCGSACDPCVATLGAVARRARQILEASKTAPE